MVGPANVPGETGNRLAFLLGIFLLSITRQARAQKDYCAYGTGKEHNVTRRGGWQKPRGKEGMSYGEEEKVSS